MKLSDESHQGWAAFAADHGVSMSVLLEVLGKHLDTALQPKARDEIVRQARALTAERRRAGGPRKKG